MPVGSDNLHSVLPRWNCKDLAAPAQAVAKSSSCMQKLERSDGALCEWQGSRDESGTDTVRMSAYFMFPFFILDFIVQIH